MTRTMNTIFKNKNISILRHLYRYSLLIIHIFIKHCMKHKLQYSLLSEASCNVFCTHFVLHFIRLYNMIPLTADKNIQMCKTCMA